jgi:chromosome segregation ATPase
MVNVTSKAEFADKQIATLRSDLSVSTARVAELSDRLCRKKSRIQRLKSDISELAQEREAQYNQVQTRQHALVKCEIPRAIN